MNEDSTGLQDSLFDVINHLCELVVFDKGDFDEFLQELIQTVRSVIPIDSCLIYYHDPHKKQLILIGSKKPHTDEIGKVVLSEGEGITGWVAEHKKIVAIEKEAYKDKRFKSFKELPEDRYESFLSVPILDRRGVVGVINLQNRLPYKFSEKQIRTVESIVKIISSAFVKIALTRQVNTLENKLEERKVIEKAKGILMKEKKFTEDEAYTYLRKEAMIKRKTMKEIAEAVLLVY